MMKLEKNRKMKIGVTGSAGSGKSLVCNRFEELGLAVFDCDKIARDVVEPGEIGLEKLAAAFGSEVVGPDGTLDRRHLRQILIRDSRHRKQIESILHPLIQSRMLDLMEAALAKEQIPGVVVEVPLLFETGMNKLFDLTIVVVADEDAQVSRIRNRDGVTDHDARKMLDIQMPQQEKMDRSDFILINKGSLLQLVESVDKLFRKIQKEFLTI